MYLNAFLCLLQGPQAECATQNMILWRVEAIFVGACVQQQCSHNRNILGCLINNEWWELLFGGLERVMLVKFLACNMKIWVQISSTHVIIITVILGQWCSLASQCWGGEARWASGTYWWLVKMNWWYPGNMKACVSESDRESEEDTWYPPLDSTYMCACVHTYTPYSHTTRTWTCNTFLHTTTCTCTYTRI